MSKIKCEARWIGLIVCNLAMILSMIGCSSTSSKIEDKLDILPGIGSALNAGTDLAPLGGLEGGQSNMATGPSPSSSKVGPDTYTIEAGDTLMKVAFDVYGDIYKWKEIYEENKGKIHDPNKIPRGTVLHVNRPGGVFVDRNGDKYLIKHGDTLALISKTLYGKTSQWKHLWENNKQLIHDPNKIFAGFYLYYLPEGVNPSVSPRALSSSPNSGENNGMSVSNAGSGSALPPIDTESQGLPPAVSETHSDTSGGLPPLDSPSGAPAAASSDDLFSKPQANAGNALPPVDNGPVATNNSVSGNETALPPLDPAPGDPLAGS